MNAETVLVRGVEDVAARLQALPRNMLVRTLRRAVRAGGVPIMRRAQALVPVRTGKLRKSIRVSTRFSRRQGEVLGTVKAGGRRKGDPFYAHFVEFGTAPHVIKPRKGKSLFVAGLFRQVVEHPGGAARPFMRPALDAEFQTAVDEIARVIGQALQADLR